MNADEILNDLRERLIRAADQLHEMADERFAGARLADGHRLSSKESGIRLALSYLNDYDRERA